MILVRDFRPPCTYYLSFKWMFAGVKNLQSLLVKRDKEISKLQAELAIAYAVQKPSISETPDANRLQAAIQMKDEQLQSCQERISELESLQNLAQDTALKSDDELELMRKQVLEAEGSRNAALDKLEEFQKAIDGQNRRISELNLARECAKAEVEEARYGAEKLLIAINFSPNTCSLIVFLSEGS